MKTSLYHVHINISNAKKSLPFYKAMFTKLGYRIIDQSQAHIAMGNGTTDLWVIRSKKEHRKKTFNRKSPGLNHLAFRVGSKKAVDDFSEEFLKERRIKTLYNTPNYFPVYEKGYYAVFFEDPDRIKLEVVFVP